MTALTVWGAGELGSRIGAGWHAGPVWGYTATPARHAALAAAGIGPRTGAPLALPAESVLVLALPGHARQGETVRQLAARGLVAPRRVVLVSTTGVYGMPRGVVDETTPPDTSARAQSIAAVEAEFRAWASERGVIMRLGGLYGPGRGPGAALARRGSAQPGPANRTLPLIHYDDAAAAVVAALRMVAPAPCYLAVTPPCPTRGDFYRAAYARLGLGEPPFDAPLPHPPARFDVSRLRRDLLPTPAYPDWHAALPSAT